MKMKMKIFSFADFINENASYPKGSFIDRAVNALQAEGFIVTVNSTPLQIKNDNLLCDLELPKGHELLSSYNLSKDNFLIFDGSSVENFFKNLKLESLIIYNRGVISHTGDANPAALWEPQSSVDEMAKVVKNLFIKEVLKRTGRVKYRSSEKLYDAYIVIPNDNKLNIGSGGHYTTVAAKDIRSYPLPPSLLDICEQMKPGFKKEYEIFQKRFPKYINLFSDTIAANVSALILASNNLIFSPFTIGKEMSAFQPSVRQYSYSAKVIIFIYADYPANGTPEELVLKEWNKIREIDSTKLEEYFKDLGTKKRGTIAGIKFNL